MCIARELVQVCFRANVHLASYEASAKLLGAGRAAVIEIATSLGVDLGVGCGLAEIAQPRLIALDQPRYRLDRLCRLAQFRFDSVDLRESAAKLFREHEIPLQQVEAMHS